jgi:hypothetical protein
MSARWQLLEVIGSDGPPLPLAGTLVQARFFRLSHQ